MADALHYAHQSGNAQAERDILREGAIYSPDAGKMLEVKKVENYVVVAVWSSIIAHSKVARDNLAALTASGGTRR